MIPGEGIYLLREKVEMILNLTPLRDVTKTRNIIGLAFYYRKFVVNLSDIVKPFTEITKKNTTFNCDPLCQLNLDIIKAAMTNS